VTVYDVAADGVNDTWHVDEPAPLAGASVQLPEPPKEPDVGCEVNLTVPVGLVAPLDAVSVTVAVHVVALPVDTEPGEQLTLVDVGLGAVRPVVPTSTSPTPAVATQNVVAAHETLDSPPSALSIAAGLLQALAPPVGLVELMSFPALSTATQSDADAQDTPLNPPAMPMLTGALQLPAPPVGSSEVSTSPSLSITTHSEVDGHETPVSS
jgi:hypothetical protein